MELIKAARKDFDEISRFYRSTILNTAKMNVHAKWIYGKHPTDEMIMQYINQGAMYFCKINGAIASAVAVTLHQGEDYHDTYWSVSANDDEISVVHILCVDPNFQRQGIAKETMRLVFELSRNYGKTAVRLDALACNKPAHKLYESLGFKKKGVRRWFAENVGWTDFFLYELVLQ